MELTICAVIYVHKCVPETTESVYTIQQIVQCYTKVFMLDGVVMHMLLSVFASSVVHVTSVMTCKAMLHVTVMLHSMRVNLHSVTYPVYDVPADT